MGILNGTMATHGVTAMSDGAAATPNPAVVRLWTALTNQSTTTAELKQAIVAVEALVSEARHKLSAALLRERCAAYEQLHAALDKDSEAALEAAVEAAQAAEVDNEDVAKGKAKLAELRALAAEQKAGAQARQLESKLTKEAFLLVKRDDDGALKELLCGLAEGMHWRNWRDDAGRSLWKCAVELRAACVQRYLAPVLGLPLPDEQRAGHRKAEQATVVKRTAKSWNEQEQSLQRPPQQQELQPEQQQHLSALFPCQSASTCGPRAVATAVMADKSKAGVSKDKAAEEAKEKEKEKKKEKEKEKAKEEPFFDEEDEFEEFEDADWLSNQKEEGGTNGQWEEDWEEAAWDEEDEDDSFQARLREELGNMQT
eukprot:NODE_1000_length_1274_cov_300.563577.p1 GENE.NODE_1000_length_1274_cov_300.563577~~NODE_1000_length_1274_cov_300.563577.p1  ORF type:complete len:370 (+),score=163.65 NODE_1000_length_1274_cov_300.563577:3-1112(+)